MRSAGSISVLRLRDVVEARVVHERRRVAVLLDPPLVAYLRDRVHRARLHVVLKTERMPHFVGHHISDQLAHEIVGQRKPVRAGIEWTRLDEVPVLRQVLNVVEELDIGLENLTRARIVDMRTHRVLGGRRQPADHRVARVFRAPVRVVLRRFARFDGVPEARGFERGTPVLDAFLDVRHPLRRRGRVDVVHDRLRGVRRSPHWGLSSRAGSVR